VLRSAGAIGRHSCSRTSCVAAEPFAPDGDWYEDFGSFILCGSGEYLKTVLARGMQPFGTAL